MGRVAASPLDVDNFVKRRFESIEVDILGRVGQHRAKATPVIPLRAEQPHRCVEQQRPRLLGTIGKHRFIKHAMRFPRRLLMALAGDVVNNARSAIIADKRRPDYGRPHLIGDARAIDFFAGMRRPAIAEAIDECELAEQLHLAIGAAMNEPPRVDIPLKVWSASHDVSGCTVPLGRQSHPRQNDFRQRLQLIRRDRRSVAARGGGHIRNEPERRLPLPYVERMLQFSVRTVECLVADSRDRRMK